MYAFYENITVYWRDADVEDLLERMSLSDFQLRTRPAHYRNSVGELTPAKSNSPEAGYRRDPANGNVLTKL